MHRHHAKPDFIPALLLVALSVVFTAGFGDASAETGTVVVNNKPPAASPTYQVKNGDTLYAIGLHSGHGYQKLALWNRIASPYLIIAGQTLKLFPPIAKKQLPDRHHKIIVTKNSDNAGRHGATSSEKKIHSRDTAVQKTQIAPSITKKKPASQEKKSIISIDNKKMLKLNFKWPINGRVLKNFSQSGNQGIDIENKTGKQPVLATESGQVVYIGQELNGLSNFSFKNLIIIKHGHDYLSAYANASHLLAREGQQIEKGQVIAEIDAAENRQNALHFEIRKNGNPVDPLNLLPK